MNISTKIKCFFVVFGTVYFLESIGGFYMTAAVTFIEKQFQIPSRLSGTMVSAGDFAYIPLVVFTSYFGGKGNRARWIGGGCILISIANMMIASSHFLFPVEEFEIDGSNVKPSLPYEVNRYILNANFSEDPDVWFNKNLELFDTDNVIAVYDPKTDGHVDESMKTYNWTQKTFFRFQMYCYYHADSNLCKKLEASFRNDMEVTAQDLGAVRSLMTLPYGFCHNAINKMRMDHVKAECRKEERTGPFFMIFSGLLILGVGRTMPFSLGLPLMDDNVKKRNLPVYFASMFFVRILGPVIGLLVGGKLNTIYYNFKPPLGLQPTDPMWIGCWWLGFLIFGCLLLFPSILLFLFPSDKLEATDEEKEKEQKALLAGEKPPVVKRLYLRDTHVVNDDHKSIGEKWNEFVTTIKCLFRNPIYVGAMAGRIVDVLAFKGFFVFLGKYLEIQFGIPQHRIQKWQAVSGIVGFAAGVMGGSIAMKYLKLEGRKAASFVAFCSLVAAFLSFLNAGVGCDSVTNLINKEGKLSNMTFPSCREDCLCEGLPLYPVCNNRKEVFFSPCHAGCPLEGANFSIFGSPKDLQQKVLNFTSCACSGTDDGIVSRANCESDECYGQFKLYFANQAIGAIFGGMGVVPGMLIILRAVNPEHRSISLGFNGFLVSLLATLPSPILWGKLIDYSCVLWQSTCSSKGACLIYDTDELRIRIHFIYGGLRVLSLLSDIWVIYWAKGLVLVNEVDDDGKAIDDKKKKKNGKTSVSTADDNPYSPSKVIEEDLAPKHENNGNVAKVYVPANDIKKNGEEVEMLPVKGILKDPKEAPEKPARVAKLFVAPTPRNATEDKTNTDTEDEDEYMNKDELAKTVETVAEVERVLNMYLKE